MKYAEVTANGEIVAFYDDAVHSDVPPGAIEIPDDDWRGHLSGEERRWDGSTWVLYTPPPPAPEQVDAQVIRSAEMQIDAVADRVYTSSVSRAARYQLKLAEAQRYAEAGYPAKPAATDYPYLSAEAEARGITPKQLAQAILAAAQAYEAFGAQAEAARARLKTEVPAAADAPAKRAAADAIVAEVQQAAQALQQ